MVEYKAIVPPYITHPQRRYYFQGIIQCVKSYGAFIDIGEDVGLLHISELSHVHVTFMEALFAFGEKVKMSFLQIKSANHCYNDYFYT
ncbi:unnamed protein product [Sphagnum jensenii]|uniref:S1 motif domain-containing protein n=1 Tax=Sphagnum jensenii TaxID=128206 RepID=A0ABP1AQU9_9BRYO